MALIDDILSPISQTLTANLDWLTTAYGRVQRLPRIRDGRTEYYPALFVGDDISNNDYIDMLPDDTRGNYCFWEIEDHQEYNIINGIARPNFKFKLIFFWKWPSLYPSDWRSRSIEEVKGQILSVLAVAQHSNAITTFTIHERGENIYSSYSIDESHEQFMMREYGGLAIEGQLTAHAGCPISMTAPTVPINIITALPFNHKTQSQVFPTEKWFGAIMRAMSWELGAGADTYVPLTGLTTSMLGKMLPFSGHAYRVTSSGKWYTAPIEVSHEDGACEIFLQSGTDNNSVTIFFRS